MAGQEQSRSQRPRRDPDDAPDPTPLTPATSARRNELHADIDNVLDEIDSVLESNAEEFVRGFVQKGGQ